MTQTLVPAMSIGRARPSMVIACTTAGWLLAGHDSFAEGAMGYMPVTATKRNIPGVLIGGLT